VAGITMTSQRLAAIQFLAGIGGADALQGASTAGIGEAYAQEVARGTGLASGSIAKILNRLVAAGLVTARSERGRKPAGRGSPPGKLYALTDAGAAWARHDVETDFHPTPLTPAEAARKAVEIIDEIDWEKVGPVRGSVLLGIVRDELGRERAWTS
jgi:DNA-binding PadR family transcriptional regulator